MTEKFLGGNGSLVEEQLSTGVRNDDQSKSSKNGHAENVRKGAQKHAVTTAVVFSSNSSQSRPSRAAAAFGFPAYNAPVLTPRAERHLGAEGSRPRFNEKSLFPEQGKVEIKPISASFGKSK